MTRRILFMHLAWAAYAQQMEDTLVRVLADKPVTQAEFYGYWFH